jgi:hypothetical protein
MSEPVEQAGEAVEEAAPVEVVNEQPEKAEDSTVEAVEESTEEKKGDLPKGVKHRFKVLTERNKAYERELAELRQQNEEIKKSIGQAKPKEVSRDQFASEAEYVQHLAREEAKRLYYDEVVKPQEMHTKAKAAEQAELAKWNEKVAEQIDDIEDFSKVVSSSSADLSQEALGAIMDSDLGPQIAYYLAKTPDEAERLEGKTGRALDRAIVRLELKVEQSTTQIPTTKPTRPSKAPAPIGKPSPTPLANNAVSIDDWVKQRRAQLYG